MGDNVGVVKCVDVEGSVVMADVDVMVETPVIVVEAVDIEEELTSAFVISK